MILSFHKVAFSLFGGLVVLLDALFGHMLPPKKGTKEIDF